MYGRRRRPSPRPSAEHVPARGTYRHTEWHRGGCTGDRHCARASLKVFLAFANTPFYPFDPLGVVVPEHFLWRPSKRTRGWDWHDTHVGLQVRVHARGCALTAASIFAGDSVFGSASIEMTEIKIDSAVWIGRQRSAADSYPNESSPGACKILPKQNNRVPGGNKQDQQRESSGAQEKTLLGKQWCGCMVRECIA